MTLGNMRELGVNNLLASCLTDTCRHTALIDVSNYPADTGARRNAVVFGHPSRSDPRIQSGVAPQDEGCGCVLFLGPPNEPGSLCVVT